MRPLNLGTKLCDLCGKPRGRGYNHDACSKKRQALGFAKGVHKSASDKAYLAKTNAKRYAAGLIKFPE